MLRALVLFSLVVASPAAAKVASCELTSTVDGGSAAYLVDCVARAEAGGHEALVIRVDTPGGSLESTREIVRALLAAKVPVITWVGPPGAHAGSAGTFVTMAGHVAAMAPGTNIGAAHPVTAGGQDPSEAAGEAMGKKIVNDTVAFARAIARERGRSEDWAEKAVRDAASIDADTAVAERVVDLVARTEDELLAALDGRVVKVNGEEVTLRVEGAPVERLEPTLAQRIVHWLANPGLAMILFLVGGLGIAIEVSNPGLIVPGLTGLVCLVLALVAFSALPIQAGGVVLLILGVGLLVAEAFFGHGVLAVAGVALLILGGVFLVDRFDPDWWVEPSFAVSLRMLLPTALALGGIAGFFAYRAAQTRSRPQLAGDVGLIGETGTVLFAVGPEPGEVFVHGERWRAVSSRPLPVGASVIVRKVEGLTLHVDEVTG